MKILDIIEKLKSIQTAFFQSGVGPDARDIEQWINKNAITTHGKITIDSRGTASFYIDINEEDYIAITLWYNGKITVDLYKSMPSGYCNWCGSELVESYHCSMCGGS